MMASVGGFAQCVVFEEKFPVAADLQRCGFPFGKLLPSLGHERMPTHWPEKTFPVGFSPENDMAIHFLYWE